MLGASFSEAGIGDASNDIEAIFDQTVVTYPECFRPMLNKHRARLLWQVGFVYRNVKPGGSLLDIGGGVVPLMFMCSKLGYKVTVVDDYAGVFRHPDDTARVLEIFDKFGVRVLHGDACAEGEINSLDQMFDLVTSHDSMEHWHNSPKRLFHFLWSRMNPSALFWIGVPNCVNLRKRMTALIGDAKWSQMEDWYEKPVFRGHVREPDVRDLRYIATDLGASRCEVIGRNWLGYTNRSAFIRAVIPLVDHALRLVPSLCSDIYLIAWK